MQLIASYSNAHYVIYIDYRYILIIVRNEK